jgi:hypothetical protein
MWFGGEHKTLLIPNPPCKGLLSCTNGFHQKMVQKQIVEKQIVENLFPFSFTLNLKKETCVYKIKVQTKNTGVPFVNTSFPTSERLPAPGWVPLG